jgi:hypothetical protein
MRFYPDIPRRRAKRLAADIAVVLLIVLFALLGLKVHDAVDKLVVVSQGVQETGGAVKSGFDQAADALDDVPIVGGDLADALRSAGESSGGRVKGFGDEGIDRTHRLANLLGLLTFLLPAAALLARYLPGRIEHIRRLTAASKVLREHEQVERRRLVAMRAAFALPYDVLLRYTSDPFGDLASEHYDALVAAAVEDVGLRARAPSGR